MRTRTLGLGLSLVAALLGTASALSNFEVWSGGCSKHLRATEWSTYCLDGTDFDTMRGSLCAGTADDGTAAYYSCISFNLILRRVI